MWIRGQDKKSLINVNRLYIGQRTEGGITKYRICNQVSWINETDDYDTLGSYESEERAIEVLDLVHGHMNEYQYSVITREFPVSKVFIMPIE